MNEKIEYEWETKEQQEQRWKKYKEVSENGDGLYKRVFAEWEKGNCSRADAYNAIYTCVGSMKTYILFDRYDDAVYSARIGKSLIDKYMDVALKHMVCLDEFDWFLTGKENNDIVKWKLVDMNRLFKIKNPKSGACVNAAIYAIKCGELETARDFMRLTYEITPRKRLNENIIYHLERFYAFVAEYLCEPEKNADMLPKLTKCFKYLFDESDKGSKKLYDPYVINLTQKEHIFYLRYIWYKYFSGRDWNTVTFEEIVQSERYGIKGLQDC